MKFVILSNKEIPGFGVKGPVLTPMVYDIHLVLKLIIANIDIREVMEDGSYRKLSFNDKRLREELNKKLEKQATEREQLKKARIGNEVRPQGNVKLMPENKPLPKKDKKQEADKKNNKTKNKDNEPKTDDSLQFIDELEKPE